MSLAMRELWSDADFVEEAAQGLREKWTSEQWRKKLTGKLRAHHNSPAEKAKRSAIAKREYHNGHGKRLIAARTAPKNVERHAILTRLAGIKSMRQMCKDEILATKRSNVHRLAAILEERYKLTSFPKSTPVQRARDMVKILRRSGMPIQYDPITEDIWLEEAPVTPKKRAVKSKA